MIESLRIERLAVLERADLEFAPGLNVLTGETGAGKSIVLGALTLLAGGRASADAVREGASEAVVEAVFRTEGLPELEQELLRRGLTGDPHELLVRRSVSRGGRSRAQIAGQLVPVSTLSELFAGRLEVSSQHESHALRRPDSHGRLLDAYGGLLARRAAVEEACAQLRSLSREVESLREETGERERRADFLAFQVREIDEADPRPGEREGLLSERARRAHAERLGGDALAVLALLAGDPGAPDADGAADRLGQGARTLEAMAALDPALRGAAERVRGTEAELRDVAAELERYADGIEVDPARLAEVEERLARLERLGRKYGGGEEAVLAFRARAAAELAALAGSDQRLAKLESERAAVEARLLEAARALGEGRRRSARRLSRALGNALVELGLEDACFEVSLAPVDPPPGVPCGPSGLEAPEFRFSANPGDSLRPLRKVASGGELSRVFLALKNVLRRAGAGMMLVFDEVDAGIGGRAADRVGRMLAELATEHQVLCITHLPQIAALADVHLRVEKRTRGGVTRARVTPLEGDARVEELARMASGAEISATTRRHARELLRSR